MTVIENQATLHQSSILDKKKCFNSAEDIYLESKNVKKGKIAVSEQESLALWKMEDRIEKSSMRKTTKTSHCDVSYFYGSEPPSDRYILERIHQSFYANYYRKGQNEDFNKPWN